MLETVVQSLKANPGNEMDLQCLMYKYAHLEASILESLEHNTKETVSSEDQSLLSEFIERYTAAGADYQATWTERYWSAYAVATRGHHRADSYPHDPPSLRDLGDKLQHVQGLAKTLTHLTTDPEPVPTKPAPRTHILHPVIEAAVKAHERQRLIGSKRGTSEGCCHRCGIY